MKPFRWSRIFMAAGLCSFVFNTFRDGPDTHFLIAVVWLLLAIYFNLDEDPDPPA